MVVCFPLVGLWCGLVTACVVVGVMEWRGLGLLVTAKRVYSRLVSIDVRFRCIVTTLGLPNTQT